MFNPALDVILEGLGKRLTERGDTQSDFQYCLRFLLLHFEPEQPEEGCEGCQCGGNCKGVTVQEAAGPIIDIIEKQREEENAKIRKVSKR